MIIQPKIAFDNYFDQTKYVIARNTALYTTAIFLTLAYFFRSEGQEVEVYYLTTGFVTLGSFIFILFSKNYQFIFYSFAIWGVLLICISSNFGHHPMHYAGTSWALLSISLGFFGIGLRFGTVLLVVATIGILNYSLHHVNENLTHLLSHSTFNNVGVVVENTAVMLLTGYVIYHFVIFYKHSQQLLNKKNKELEEKNEFITNQNEEKTVLVKEIHHRIKNNLQIIISLLRMQKMEMHSEEAEEHFSEAINRIMTMSLIHQKLYKQEELSKIDLKSYITELVDDLISVSLMNGKVKLKVSTNIEHMSLDMVVPLGLLINELVSNSLKYAFLEMEEGEIKIRLNQGGGQFGFAYIDNGKWKEPEENSTGFGAELIEILTEQLNGTKTVNLDNGTSYNFTLKEPTNV